MSLLHAVATAQNPLFTVILPLPDGREHAREAFAAWLNQDISAHQFQIVAVSDGLDTALEKDIRAGLRPGDRMEVEPGIGRARLYQLGASVACGQYLVLTESHCLARPDFLREMLNYLELRGFDGAMCHTDILAETATARAEAWIDAEAMAEFRRDGDWRKAYLHGLAIRRDAYVHAGGIDSRYDHFAEVLLLAALRDRGYRLGYAARAAVLHVYQSDLRENQTRHAAMIADELAYRTDHPGPDRIGLSHLDPRWTMTGDCDLARAVVKTLAADLFRAAFRLDRDTFLAWWQARRMVPPTSWWSGMTGSFRRAFSRLRFHLNRWSFRRLIASYHRLCFEAGREAVLRFRQERTPTAPPMFEARSFSLDEIDEANLIGFHAVERHRGEPFRWTGRVAALRLPLPSSSAVVTLRTYDLRQPLSLIRLKLYLNGQRIPAAQVRIDGGRLRFPVSLGQVEPGRSSILVLTCKPLQPWKAGVDDRRELGVPLFRIETVVAAERGAVRAEAARAARSLAI